VYATHEEGGEKDVGEGVHRKSEKCPVSGAFGISMGLERQNEWGAEFSVNP
jgi:hypothetical protein